MKNEITTRFHISCRDHFFDSRSFQTYLLRYDKGKVMNGDRMQPEGMLFIDDQDGLIKEIKCLALETTDTFDESFLDRAYSDIILPAG